MDRTARPSLSLGTIVLLLLLGTQVVHGDRTAPNGTLTPRRGPYAGKPCKYGDGSDKYTQVAEYSLAEIEAFIRGKKDPWEGTTDVRAFLAALREHDWTYGGQLSREGYDRYKELVQACLEDGKVNAKAEYCRHKAPQPIGISINTGKPTAEYEMNINHLGYWIIEPGEK